MNNTSSMKNISSFIYGTTRLGDEHIPFKERVTVACAAINAGVWFHTSRQYGNALELLSAAFDKDRTKIPTVIAKIGGDNIEALTADIKRNLEPLGLKSLDVGQLCIGGELAQDFAAGGTSVKKLERIRESGLVKSYVLEVFPWTSQTALKALQGGSAEGIVDAFILYLNPLQRFASNELWDVLIERDQSIIALRTVAGGPVHRLRDVPGAAWKEYLQKRAVQVAPIFERSGITSWTEFCLRFARSIPNVLATVGAAAKLSNLNEFLAAKESKQFLSQDLMEEIFRLQRRWSDELDIHAEPWTM
ncbi:MAG TPA: aldo/keto reductase [Bacteroidota bacterium]|nr:aldo/keto reductase [Bacteroidota bacterium]